MSARWRHRWLVLLAALLGLCPAARAMDDDHAPAAEAWDSAAVCLPYQQSSLSGLPIRVAAEDDEAAPEPSAVVECFTTSATALDWLWDGVELLGLDRLPDDLRHDYTGRNLRRLGWTLALAAPFANTGMDDNFQSWYQRHVRSAATDDFARIGNKFGEHWLTVPAFLAAIGIGRLCEDHPAGSWLGAWGQRSVRAMIIGSLSVGVLQYGLGAGRPGEFHHSSYWRPFHDNNAVAGHSFVGAVPFLTAAAMTENRLLKGVLFAGSFWTCWARINNDAHFLSQTILAWSIAYLAVDSVRETDNERRAWELTPLLMPDGGAGLGILLRY